MNGKVEELVRYRLRQSAEALETSRLLGELKRFPEAINRAYYSMFYSVLALLALEKKETSKHQGAIALFDVEFVKTNRFPREYSKWLHRAFEQRLDADYLPFFAPEEQEAHEIIDNASAFASGVAEWIGRVIGNHEGKGE